MSVPNILTGAGSQFFLFKTLAGGGNAAIGDLQAGLVDNFADISVTSGMTYLSSPSRYDSSGIGYDPNSTFEAAYPPAYNAPALSPIIIGNPILGQYNDTVVVSGNNYKTIQVFYQGLIKVSEFVVSDTQIAELGVGLITDTGISVLALAPNSNKIYYTIYSNAYNVWRALSIQVPTNTVDFVLMDANSDGKSDILSVDKNGNVNLKLFSSYIPIVDSFFQGYYTQAYIDYSLGNIGFIPSPLVGGFSAGCLAVGDINNDGKPDLLVIGASNYSVLLNQGSGAFAKSASFASGTGTTTAKLGDVDGDGFLDIVAANGSINSISVLLGHGDGTFGPVQYYTLPTVAGAPLAPIDIELADFNGDKNMDVVASGSSYSYLLYNHAPTITSNSSSEVDENISTSVTVYQISATDLISNSSFSFSISGGPDANLFNINVTTGAVSFKTSPNFEAPADADGNNKYDIIVAVSDGSLVTTKAVAITVTNVNEIPSITSAGTATTSENVSSSTAVYTVTASDPDANTNLTYSIVSGVDAGLFNINNSTGAVTFKASPNYEVPADSGANNVYDIVVKASDGLLSATQAVAITVTNVNETPTITSAATATTPENIATSTAVYTVTATDPDANTTLTYSISPGGDAGQFNINSSTGAVTFKASPDFEAPVDAGKNNVYDITVRASDGSLLADKLVAITVTDLPDSSVANLHGMDFFWKANASGQHALLSGVNVSATGGTQPVEGANAPIQFKNVIWDATGHATVDVYAHVTTAVDSVQINLGLGSATNATFSSALTSDWTLLGNPSGGECVIGGYSVTPLVTGDIKLGTLAFDTGSAAQMHLAVDAGSSLGSSTVTGSQGTIMATPYGMTLAHSTTGADGTYTISPLDPGTYALTASRSTSDIGNAITSADALAALKIAVGMNPNPGSGSSQLALSPFQIIAADVNADGRVTSADALGILKIAVRMSTAATPQWMFVDETRDLSGLSRTNANWDHNISVRVAGDTTDNLAGVLTGDVNGSWTPPTGTQYVETADPNHFTYLYNTLHLPLSEWGVL